MRIIVVLALLARTAHAGLDCTLDDSMKLVEAFAMDKSKPPPENSYAWFCLSWDAVEIKSRVEKACRKIVDRDGEKSECMKVAAAAGIGKLGDHDIFAYVAAMKEDPTNSEDGRWPKVALLRQLGDPRGAAVLVEMWKAALPKVEKMEKRHYSLTEWSSWRQAAADVLGKLGGADEKRFLEEQSGLTRDKYVAQACRDAATEIAKRLAGTHD